MNKKIVTDLLVIVIAFVLFVLWYENRFENKVTATSLVNNYSVYLITPDKSTEFWYIIDQGASDMAIPSGINYTWDAPQKRIIEEQITKINNAVSAGADAIMIAPSDPIKVSEAINAAKAAGVKIIYVDAPSTEEGIVTLATDNYGAGITAGKVMLDELESAGIKSGSVGILGIAEGTLTTMNRERGFREALEKDGRFKLLATKYTNADEAISNEAAVAFIRENPDLVGLFGTSEVTAISVGNAIKDSNKEIIGIGFDLTAAIDQMIKADYLKASMVQNPYTMGYLGMAETIAALNGFNTGPTYLNTGVSIWTKYSH